MAFLEGTIRDRSGNILVKAHHTKYLAIGQRQAEPKL